jgi:hypothetical protein
MELCFGKFWINLTFVVILWKCKNYKI